LFFTSGFRERASGELVADVRHADPYPNGKIVTGRKAVIDGPFAESKEAIGGFLDHSGDQS
jgi:hypothetical protein